MMEARDQPANLENPIVRRDVVSRRRFCFTSRGSDRSLAYPLILGVLTLEHDRSPKGLAATIGTEQRQPVANDIGMRLN
jgi:hypothetical protein